jgi:hypothetical protein
MNLLSSMQQTSILAHTASSTGPQQASSLTVFNTTPIMASLNEDASSTVGGYLIWSRNNKTLQIYNIIQIIKPN